MLSVLSREADLHVIKKVARLLSDNTQRGEREREKEGKEKRKGERVKERPCRGARLVNGLHIDLPAQFR